MQTGPTVTIPVPNPEQPFGAAPRPPATVARGAGTPVAVSIRSVAALLSMTIGWIGMTVAAFLLDPLAGLAWISATALVGGVWLGYEET